MKLVNKSQQEWLEQGGVSDALDGLETVVAGMSKQAADNNVSFKEIDENLLADDLGGVEAETADDTIEEVTEEAVEEKSVETVEAETEEVEQDVEQETEDVNVAGVIVDAVAKALKQYHEDVVTPMFNKLTKELSEAKEVKQKSHQNLLQMSELLPSAAVADAIKKEFGIVEKEVEVEGESVNEEVDEKQIDEVVVNNEDKSQLGLLADF